MAQKRNRKNNVKTQKPDRNAIEQNDALINTSTSQLLKYKWVIIAIILLFFSIYALFKWISSKTENIPNSSIPIYIIGAILIGIFIFLILYLPKQQVKTLQKNSASLKQSEFEREKERLKLEDDTRKTVSQILGGACLIIGLVFTYNTHFLNVQQQDLNREGQFAERFNKAISNLGNNDLVVRQGGLFELERLLRDHEKDHWTIIENLAAYIRERAKRNTLVQNANRLVEPSQKGSNLKVMPSAAPTQEASQLIWVTTDVQLALDIIGRRPTGNERSEDIIDLSDVNLTGARLDKLNFNRARFYRSDFNRANLIGANLSYADFSHASLFFAYLNNADLKFSNFRSANLQMANLNSADLTGANLKFAKLKEAGLKFAKLKDADLRYTNLEGAFALRVGFGRRKVSNAQKDIDEEYDVMALERLMEAIINEETILPKDLEPYREKLLLKSLENLERLQKELSSEEFDKRYGSNSY